MHATFPVFGITQMRTQSQIPNRAQPPETALILLATTNVLVLLVVLLVFPPFFYSSSSFFLFFVLWSSTFSFLVTTPDVAFLFLVAFLLLATPSSILQTVVL